MPSSLWSTLHLEGGRREGKREEGEGREKGEEREEGEGGERNKGSSL